jgi:hypothetical protein
MALQHQFNTRQVLLAAIIMLAIVFMFFMAVSTMSAQSGGVSVTPTLNSGNSDNLQQVQQHLNNQQTTFIENRGQWDTRAKFLMQSGGLDLWITERGVVYDIYASRATPSSEKGDNRLLSARISDDRPKRMLRTGHIVSVSFEGTSFHTPMVRGTDRLPGYYNYFIGNNPSKWATNVPLYSGARIEGLYEGIDAIFYRDNGRPRYDLIVAPGADPSQIEMKLEGATGVSVTAAGALSIQTSMGAIEQRELYTYQQIGSQRREIACRFKVDEDQQVRFEFGEYDQTRPLVIDPLLYSTLLGGYGSDIGYDITLDAGGKVYVAGATSGGTGFPTTTGAYDQSYNGGYGAYGGDAYVTKLDPSASGSAQLVYSTFLGGTGADVAMNVNVDANGMIYLSGETDSSGLPTTSGAFDGSYNGGALSYSYYGGDLFLAKLDPSASGSAQLAYCSYLGTSGDDFCGDMTIDSAGYIYMTGRCESGFPTTSGAYGSSAGAYVIKFDPSASGLAQLLYSTTLGGSWSRGTGIGIDPSGYIYVSGSSGSGFPVTSGGYDQLYNGGYDLFITKLNPSASGNAQLVYSTYLGGSDDDECRGMALDANGNIYVTGRTFSLNYPTTSGAYDELQEGSSGNPNIFVTKLDPSTSQLSYSTYIGSDGWDDAEAITVDAYGAAYVTGFSSANYPTTSGAYDITHSSAADVIVTKFDSLGRGLAYSTLLGGTSDDQAYGIALDAGGNIWVTGTTSAPDSVISGWNYNPPYGILYTKELFPTTTGAYNTSHHDSTHHATDAFVSKLGMPSFILTAPNGGETWCPGSNRVIVWNSTGIANVKIELSSDGGSTFPTTIVASTSATAGSYSWTIPANLTVGSNYRIRISNAANSSVKDAGDASFTINFVSPTVTTHPQSNSPVCAGTNVTFNAAATGATYAQWQLSTNSGASWSNISNATSASYQIVSPTGSMNGYRYRAAFSDACGTTSYTNAATLSVNALPVITQQPQHDTTITGNSAQFQAIANPASSVKWQLSTNGGSSWSDLSGANSSSYDSATTSGSVTTYWHTSSAGLTTWSITSGIMTTSFSFTSALSQNGYCYRALFTNSPCSGVNSGSATLTVNTPPIVTTNPTSNSPACSGTNVTFSAAATGSTSVQWQASSNSGSSWSNISGATSTSYTVTSPSYSLNGRQYRAIFTNAYGSTTTTAATLTISPLPAVTDQPDNDVIIGGHSAFYGTSAINASSVQWQQSTNNGSTWTDLAGANSTSGYDSTTYINSILTYCHTSSAGTTKWSFTNGTMIASFKFTGSLSYNGRLYRAAFSNGYCTTSTASALLTVQVRASDLGPAVVFVSASNSADVGRQVDIKVEISKNNTIICSGTLNNQSVTGTTQSGSKKLTIPLDMINGSVDFDLDDILKVKIYGKCNDGLETLFGSAGTKFWYNDSPDEDANSTLKGWARIAKETDGGSSASYYYLRSSNDLRTSAGSSVLYEQVNLGTSWAIYDTWTMYGSSMKPAATAVTGAATTAVVLPNPAYSGQAEILLSLSKPATPRISIYDLMGNILMQLPPVEVDHAGMVTIPVDLSTLAAGIYSVRIDTGDEAITMSLTVVH